VTRPAPEVIALVDALLARLDATTITEPGTASATSSYVAIVNAWERFKSKVDGLDQVVAQPFTAGAARMLMSADSLAGVELDRLVFWLVHVGEALLQDSPQPPPSSSP
jgi:hypothetical protein